MENHSSIDREDRQEDQIAPQAVDTGSGEAYESIAQFWT